MQRRKPGRDARSPALDHYVILSGAHMRIAIGSFVNESNSFSPVSASWLHFAPEQILRGQELIDQRIGTRTELGGIIDVARERGMELVPLLAALGSASAGVMRGDVFATIRDELLERLRGAGSLDGVLLVLHGAMAAEGYEDATGEVLRAFRSAL